MNIYGPIVGGKDVIDATKATLVKWMPDYLAEIAAQKHPKGRDSLPVFRSYVEEVDMDKFVEDQIPACIIAVPGIVGEPEDHSGRFTVPFHVSIGAVVIGNDRENTYLLSTLYATAIRMIMLQKRSLGGFADGVRWTGENYEPALGVRDARTLGAGVVDFTVLAKDVVDRTQGPDVPYDPSTEPGDWPEVLTTEFELEAKSG